MNKADYFKEEFKMEFKPDRTPFVYTHLTDSFAAKLDSMFDQGSALLSNRIIMTGVGSLIEQISRVNDAITISLNKDMAMKLKGDGINEVIGAYFNDVIGIIEKYKVPGNFDQFTPLFTCGYTYIPDQAPAYIIDTGISYDRFHNKYDVMVQEKAYKILVAPYKNYIKSIIRNIMGASKIKFYDEQCSISIMDAATGNGPEVNKAIAYTMSVLFILYGIDNMLWYKNQLTEENVNQQMSQQPQINDSDGNPIQFNIQIPEELEKEDNESEDSEEK